MTTLFSGPSIVAWAALAVAVLLGVPRVVDTFTLSEITVFLVLAMLALSLAFVWGVGGILSFGQSAFFGLGGYAYAIGVLNFGESTFALLLSVVVPSLFAALLGYFMFYGRISDVYLAVITLTVSLILFNLLNSTGSQYRIGSASLGGANGIPGLPALNLPGEPERPLDFVEMFQFAAVLLIAIYLGLRLLVRTHFGRVVVAIRENEVRAELLGYDARAYKLGVFVIGGAIAGFAGALYATWGSFIGPSVFSMAFSAQIIIWVLTGGLGTFFGPVLATVLIQYGYAWLGQTKGADPNIVLGIVFILFVLFLPSGLQPVLTRLGRTIVACSRKLAGGPSSRP